ncbi:ImmA/IrrE family metallo-endopeptidase [Mucilaginibacter sp.]|uniref:ImmA/IrrE family metallo-endopeptidase n=1 Tax=Mucilaginibacter sp. TaxID=1882438 RepID=UPI002634D135|nr:ImmA/IrrE family metallo-endopeptidase [Mucilaginibacter sp.]MDB4921208.1 hypothetical protein [Mucilaginibacter sp.]
MSKSISNLKFKKVTDAALQLLVNAKVTKVPIDVLRIARLSGVVVEQTDLGDDVSGLLVIHDRQAVIAYSPNQGEQRKRFTIAHELGHYILHNQDSSDAVFVDKDFIVKYRSQKAYSEIEMRQEQEANAFAASLLMPKELIFEELKNDKLQNMSEIQVIDELARIFDVSIPAMTFRLSNLNILY